MKITIPASKIMESQKERYNAHQTGTGAHKSKKTYRRKSKHPNKFDY